jgi:hypothetical protein
MSLNFFRNPRAFREVEIGGRLLKARLQAEHVEGLKVEAEWKEQKSTGTSGATQTYQGMKPAGPHKLTFECVNLPHATAEAQEDDLIAVRDMMLPQPGLSGNAATSTATSTPASASSTAAPAAPTTAEGLLKQAQAALAALNNPTAATSTASAGATSSSSKAAASTGANPGPKPPTFSIRNGGVNDLGTTAISLKSYERKFTKGGTTLHIFELIPQKPVVAAGTGVAPAKSPDKPGGVPTGFIGPTPAEAAAAQSAVAGAGT